MPSWYAGAWQPVIPPPEERFVKIATVVGDNVSFVSAERGL
jgi:hypothetical protein